MRAFRIILAGIPPLLNELLIARHQMFKPFLQIFTILDREGNKKGIIWPGWYNSIELFFGYCNGTSRTPYGAKGAKQVTLARTTAEELVNVRADIMPEYQVGTAIAERFHFRPVFEIAAFVPDRYNAIQDKPLSVLRRTVTGKSPYEPLRCTGLANFGAEGVFLTPHSFPLELSIFGNHSNWYRFISIYQV